MSDNYENPPIKCGTFVPRTDAEINASINRQHAERCQCSWCLVERLEAEINRLTTERDEARTEGADAIRMLNEIGERLTAAGVMEDSYAECVSILARQRDEARAELAALREATRVRDAREELPAELPGDTNWVLVWIDGLWESAFWGKRDGEKGWHWYNDTLPASEFPFWLPMPSDPEEPR